MTSRAAGPLPDDFEWSAPEAARHPYFVADVFTSRSLEGNQLGVFTDGRPFADDEMQRLAREMNFAETVFLFPPQQGGDVRIRIFTPRAELPFAGHPVLGTAFVAGAALGLETVMLETPAGSFPIALERDGGRIVFGRMTQSIPTPEPYEHAGQMLAALGLDASELPVEAYRNGPRHVFIKLPSEAAVAALAPDLAALGTLSEAANCFAGSGTSWKVRMFAPGLGVNEDPATGSAAGPLALHLARHGEIAFGDEIEIRQGDEIGRPSRLFSRVLGSAEEVTKIEVGGVAVIVARGEFRVPATVPVRVYAVAGGERA